jgi:hypothetical protein
MYLDKLVHSTTGKYIMSILLGFGLASVFRTICKDKNCIAFYAPPLDEVDDKIYKQDGKCYLYHGVPTKCKPQVRTVPIENKST